MTLLSILRGQGKAGSLQGQSGFHPCLYLYAHMSICLWKPLDPGAGDAHWHKSYLTKKKKKKKSYLTQLLESNSHSLKTALSAVTTEQYLQLPSSPFFGFILSLCIYLCVCAYEQWCLGRLERTGMPRSWSYRWLWTTSHRCFLETETGFSAKALNCRAISQASNNKIP